MPTQRSRSLCVNEFFCNRNTPPFRPTPRCFFRALRPFSRLGRTPHCRVVFWLYCTCRAAARAAAARATTAASPATPALPRRAPHAAQACPALREEQPLHRRRRWRGRRVLAFFSCHPPRRAAAAPAIGQHHQLPLPLMSRSGAAVALGTGRGREGAQGARGGARAMFPPPH